MAGLPQKRPHDEPEAPESTEPTSSSKRQCSSVESEEGEPAIQPEFSAVFQPQDLSAVLQPQDLSAFDFDFLPAEDDQIHSESTADSSAACSSSDEDDGVNNNSVMRRLLEASDDELGIPNCSEDNNCAGTNHFEKFPFDFWDEKLWEFEDAAAGYYIMLQSELFM